MIFETPPSSVGEASFPGADVFPLRHTALCVLSEPITTYCGFEQPSGPPAWIAALVVVQPLAVV